MAIKLHTSFVPKGDQPKAISEIVSSYKSGNKHHCLLGVTGSGKTFTMAHIIAQLKQSALIIAPNKTLAAQLFVEFKEFFPNDSVNFFISYFDYYQPEAYIPSTDTYIEKDSSINDDIDKMRHQCTRELFEKPRTIIIASVSCIYGLGSPQTYSDQSILLKVGSTIDRDQFFKDLIAMRYQRNHNLDRGMFRVNGEVCDIIPPSENSTIIRLEFCDDQIEEINLLDQHTLDHVQNLNQLALYPNSHYVVDDHSIKNVITQIQDELRAQLQYFKRTNKLEQYQRLEQRVLHDIESFQTLGYCSGIENYSRYLTGTKPGFPPPTLIDYFPEDFITIIDESHLTVPQIRGMYLGDRSRKMNLVNFGFRLPSALDNRPLNFDEFMDKIDKVLYVSATPGVYELDKTKGNLTEQIIRPTGLIDPMIEVRPALTQIDDLYSELSSLKTKQKCFVLTLTKKMAEEIAKYFEKMNLRIKYMHSNIDTLDREKLLKDLREDHYDILVGINLLREGLDIPEIVLVAVMDADKEGFLRSRSSLVQMVGRAARNVDARVIFYADKITKSMQEAITETKRRRDIQTKYNQDHDIVPKTIFKKVSKELKSFYRLGSDFDHKVEENANDQYNNINNNNYNDQRSSLTKELDKSNDLVAKQVKKLTKKMEKAAAELNFEKALEIKQQISKLKNTDN